MSLFQVAWSRFIALHKDDTNAGRRSNESVILQFNRSANFGETSQGQRL
jgi:hypothetical protein